MTKNLVCLSNLGQVKALVYSGWLIRAQFVNFKVFNLSLFTLKIVCVWYSLN